MLLVNACSHNYCCYGKSNKYYIFWVWACSFSYPVSKVHATYYICCYLLPVQQYIFPHYLINSTILVGGIIQHKMCNLIFSITSIWNISHSEKNSVRYYHTCTYIFNESISYSRQLLIKLYFPQNTFETSSNTKFHENPSTGANSGAPNPTPLGWKEKQVLQQHVIRLLYFHQTLNKDQLVCHSNDNTHFLLNFRSTRGWEQLTISDPTGFVF